MFTLLFLQAAIERGVKTFCQALAAALLAAGTGIIDADWSAALSVAGMAALLSLLTSYGSGVLSSTDGPSLGSGEHIG